MIDSTLYAKSIQQTRRFIRRLNHDAAALREAAELRALYSEALETSCNTCAIARTCEYCPGWGKPVRLRCPLHVPVKSIVPE